jgi:hypothetical protein
MMNASQAQEGLDLKDTGAEYLVYWRSIKETISPKKLIHDLFAIWYLKAGNKRRLDYEGPSSITIPKSSPSELPEQRRFRFTFKS